MAKLGSKYLLLNLKKKKEKKEEEGN